MRWNRRYILGFAAILAGLFILLTLVLPTNFWWFLAGIALIAAGIWYIRCC